MERREELQNRAGRRAGRRSTSCRASWPTPSGRATRRSPRSTSCDTNRVSRRDELVAGAGRRSRRALRTSAGPRRRGRRTAAGPPVRRVPDRDRPRRAGPDLRGRRGRGAALPGVRRNPVAGQGTGAVKVIVEADGGSRGNPGPAGYGVGGVVGRSRARCSPRASRPSARATNNVAEYRGLIAGLEEAAETRRHRGRRADGLQARGRADVGPLEGQTSRHRRLHQQATALASRFDRITYAWIPRAKNCTPTGWPTRRWTPPPKSRLRSGAQPVADAVVTPGWTGARGAPTRFLLLRHGQTELSVQRRYSGRGNPALTDLGRRQAEAAAQYLAAARRHRGRHHLTAAARLRHRGDGGEGARPRRHRRRRPDRNRFRRLGRADVRRGRRA